MTATNRNRTVIPVTDEELRAYPKVTCVIAAKYLGIDPEVLRCGVEDHDIPIGYVPPGRKRRGNMWVCVEALIKYKHGEIDTACLTLYKELHKENAELKERVSKIERMLSA